MQIYIFSYNRGRYLANCVKSVRALALGCRCEVVDDNSDDSETGSGVEVIRRKMENSTLTRDPELRLCHGDPAAAHHFEFRLRQAFARLRL